MLHGRSAYGVAMQETGDQTLTGLRTTNVIPTYLYVITARIHGNQRLLIGWDSVQFADGRTLGVASDYQVSTIRRKAYSNL